METGNHIHLVSVIIPTFKRPAKLIKAINSVINQDYKYIEIVIVDDNGIDSIESKGTISIVNALNDERIIVELHNENRGACEARNSGIKRAKGKYICFLDDDDEYYPNKISEQINAIITLGLVNKSVIVFVGAVNIGDTVYKNSKWLNTVKDVYYTPDRNLILSKNYIGSNSYVLIDRESLIKIGCFDRKMDSCQDWDLFIRLALNQNVFVGVNKILVKYYSHQELRITNSLTKRVSGHLRIEEKFSSIIKDYHKAYYVDFYKYLFYQILEINKNHTKRILNILISNNTKFNKLYWIIYGNAIIILASSSLLMKYLRMLKNMIIKKI